MVPLRNGRDVERSARRSTFNQGRFTGRAGDETKPLWNLSGPAGVSFENKNRLGDSRSESLMGGVERSQEEKDAVPIIWKTVRSLIFAEISHISGFFADGK